MDLSSYLDLFVAEAREHIGAASEAADVMDAARAPEGLRELFRHVHSVKGMAASMGFGAMSALAHDAESLMDHLREGRLSPRPEIRSVLSAALICLERMVDRAESRQPVDDDERTPIQARLRQVLRDASRHAEDAGVDPGGSARAAVPSRAPAPAGAVRLSIIVGRERAFPSVRAAIVLGQLSRLGRIVRTDPPMAALRGGRFDGRLQVLFVSELPGRLLADRVAAIEDVDTFTLVPAELPPEKTETLAARASLRIRADRLDGVIDDVLDLMSSVGRIDSRAEGRSTVALTTETQAARLLVRRAYEGLVEMRLVPFTIVSHRLRRGAEELSRSLAKSVSLEFEGESVKIDRSLLEKLVDPLLHLVRNAIDHGIEPGPGRETARKPARGRVRVHVVRRVSHLSITVEDDGRGLDPRLLKELAIEKGLLTPGDAAMLSDPGAFELITNPGFTTVENATEVSGRGVGMDVVKGAVEVLGGRLRIESRVGRGTRFELILPPAVALVQAYMIRAGGTTFAVPLAALARTAPTDDNATTWHDGRRFCTGGDESVEVFALAEILGLAAATAGASAMALIGETASGRQIGFEVDEVVGKKDLVVRPLPAPLSGLKGYSGAAVLDDGSIVLVIDPGSLPLPS